MKNDLKTVTVNIEFLVEDISLLSAILDEGFTVNHSCRDGRCKECSMRVVNSVSETEQLACQFIPNDGDIVEFTTLEEFKLPSVFISPTKIHSIELINDKYRLIEFRLPPSKKLNFLPGQYIDLVIPVSVIAHIQFAPQILEVTISKSLLEGSQRVLRQTSFSKKQK